MSKRIPQLPSQLTPNLSGYTVYDDGNKTYKMSIDSVKNLVLSGLTIDNGSYATTGSNNFTGDQVISGSLIIGVGGSITDFDVFGPEKLHIQSSGSNDIAHFKGNNHGFSQINVQNTHGGEFTSTDIVVTNDIGDDFIYFGDFGINSSQYSGDEVGFANDVYLIGAGNDLYIGTSNSALSGDTNHVYIFSNGNWTDPQNRF